MEYNTFANAPTEEAQAAKFGEKKPTKKQDGDTTKPKITYTTSTGEHNNEWITLQ